MYIRKFLGSLPSWVKGTYRSLRTRALVAEAAESHYVVTNPKTADNWPPKHDNGDPITLEKCKKIMYDLNAVEIERMSKARKFNVSKTETVDM